MARYIFEGYTKVWWVSTIAVPNAPTTTEITAGIDLTPFVSKDGVKPGTSQNMVNNATINETFDSQLVGSWGGEMELTMFRDAVGADDDAWTACVHGTLGYVVIRRGITSGTAIAATQKVEVWPAQMHQPVVHASATNEQVRFTEKFAITSQPYLNATVA
jgi:hypothetical protein